MSATFNGKVHLTHRNGTLSTVIIDGDNGNIVLGGDGHDGDIEILDSKGNPRFRFSADGMWFEGKDADGNRVLSVGTTTNLRMGGHGQDGDVFLFPPSATDIGDGAQATIHLNANSGDIILRNADLSEDFEVTQDAIAPGSLLVINDEGRLEESRKPYDTRVAGVVSGAGRYKPGMILDRQPGVSRRSPIALSGKVCCKAWAVDAPICVGDLLTTSPHAGHAMKVSAHDRALGAIVGKALAPLKGGLGEIPILVALQ